MTVSKHVNPEYDAAVPNGVPDGVGDRYYAQDLFRDFYYIMDRMGLSLGDIQDQTKFIINGGYVTQESPVGDKEISITAGVGYVQFQVQVPNSFASLPPTTQNEDIEFIRVNWGAQSNVDASGATYDGATVNYVKIRYTELDGSTRSRAKKAGTWAYEQSPSFTIVIDSVAPTDYDLVLTSFTAVAGGTMTFNDTLRTDLFGINRSTIDNLLINGNFRFAQRNTNGTATFTAATTLYPNSDDTYLLDRWLLLSDGNDIVDVSQDTDVPNNKGLSMKSLVATINKKWGFLQPIENATAAQLQDKKVSLSFWAKTTAAKLINNVRAAVISWDGAADTITSDVVSAWNASGADPTLVANWTYENTPSDLALGTSWRKFVIDGIDVDTASMTNLAVFIWVDDTDAALNDELFLAEVSLIQSSVMRPVRFETFENELIKCQRFFEKSWNLTTAIGTAIGNGQIAFTSTVETSNGTYSMTVTGEFKVVKRIQPTNNELAIYDNAGNGGFAASSRATVGSDNNRALTGITAGDSRINVSASAGGTAVENRQMFYHFVCDVEL